LLAPDIYLSGSDKVLKVLDLYSRSDNPLFVPEIGANEENARYIYSVLANGGIGFSPFGIDENMRGISEVENAKRLEPVGKEYAMAGPLMRELAKWAFEGKIKALVETEDKTEKTIDFGLWQAVVQFGASGGRGTQPNAKPVGKAMVIQLGENEFILIGTLCRFTFKPLDNNAGKAWQYLKVEEGTYENGKFKLLRIRNGDETDWGGPRIGASPAILHTTLTVR
jgi:hypothetical protein